MLNNKAQALVEFILIFPILIMILFAVIDFGRIFVNKNELETALGSVLDSSNENINEQIIYDLVNKNKTKEISVTISQPVDGYVTINLYRTIDIITPGLNLILSSPYKVEVSRVIRYE